MRQCLCDYTCIFLPHSYVLMSIELRESLLKLLNPFAPGDFAEKRVLKLVEWFSGHCRAIKS